jgi:hypothetical protein
MEYANRASAIFNTTVGVDHVLVAANMARAWAQRTWKFEHAKTLAYVVLTDNAGSLSSAKKYVGDTALRVRSLERAYILVDSVLVPIDLIRREEQVRRVQAGENVSDAFNPTNITAVQNGLEIYMWSTSETYTRVYFDAIEFLAELTDVSTPDFFLTECHDWLVWRTLTYLNTFLKEDERLVIGKELIIDAWEAVKNWDAAINADVLIEV